MNDKIQKLSYKNLLFVDIKTVRGEKTFDENHPSYHIWAWKQRDKENNELPDVKDVIQSYYNKAALYAEWGKIVCISVGYIQDKKIHLKSIVGEEKNILLEFVELVKKSNRMLVGYNLIAFDIPYIRKRFFINGLTNYFNVKQGNDVYAKPWDLDAYVFDLMVAWKGSGYVNSSLDEVAMAFGVKSSKGDMMGYEVSKYYYDGRVEEIARYCEEDVRVVAEILQKWKRVSEINSPATKDPAPKDGRAENFFS